MQLHARSGISDLKRDFRPCPYGRPYNHYKQAQFTEKTGVDGGEASQGQPPDLLLSKLVRKTASSMTHDFICGTEDEGRRRQGTESGWGWRMVGEWWVHVL